MVLRFLAAEAHRFSACDSIRWSFAWSSFLKALVLRTRWKLDHANDHRWNRQQAL